MSSLIWKEKADVASPMPHEALAMPLISSAFERPSLPWLARSRVLAKESALTARHSSGVGHLLRSAFELSPKVSEKTESYSGNTWSSATITWRFKSATLSLSAWCRRVSCRSSIIASSPSLLGWKPPQRSVSATSTQSTTSVFTRELPLKRRIASVRMGFTTTTA